MRGAGYSLRRAAMGSMRVALRAGTEVAASAARPSTIATQPRMAIPADQREFRRHQRAAQPAAAHAIGIAAALEVVFDQGEMRVDLTGEFPFRGAVAEQIAKFSEETAHRSGSLRKQLFDQPGHPSCPRCL